ncbi:MAG: two-component system, OmpR family, sensor histidine kinase PrrB, partial [Thermoleophilaceae bacterium]|nr:two-component system, OmpR family, sensor histidine kinase PrrB [Thermoleophilaceae bacterium]
LRQRVALIGRRPPPRSALRPGARGTGSGVATAPGSPPPGFPGGAPQGAEPDGDVGPPPEERLLAGSGSFVQVAVGGRVVQQRGDVPSGAPGVPTRDGLSTVTIDGESWRALTTTLPGDPAPRVEVVSSLDAVEHRVDNTRQLVIWLGLAALGVTALTAWGFTTLAVRPLARLRSGAARVSGAEHLNTTLPDDDGPEEVRSLARTLNEMLARLRTSSEAMERALQATRRFAADAGHELRTPLTGMRANLDTIARNPDLPQADRDALVREVVAEQDRIVHLLDGLQALARGEAAETLAREEVELGDVVDAALYAARRRHPDVTYELTEADARATVSGWEGGLRLLIDNLLDNAALHGRPGGRVDVGVERDDGSLVVRVDDDGPGVPAAERERILEPFRRGEAASAAGTGLGLAIVAQQVALHGGRLELDDSERGGLAVRVELPVNGGAPPAALDSLPPRG